MSDNDYATLKNEAGNKSSTITRRTALRLLQAKKAMTIQSEPLIIQLVSKREEKKNQKLQAEFDPNEWLKLSQRKLVVAKADFDRNDLNFAVSSLQGSEERVAKALLLQVGIVSKEDFQLFTLMKAFVNEKYCITPKELSHIWHIKMLENFDAWLTLLQIGWTAMQFAPRGWRAATYWDLYVSRMRKRIEAIGKLRSIPIPTVKELTEVVSDCNKMLDVAKEAFKEREKPLKIHLPSSSRIHPMVMSLLRSMFIVYEDRSDIRRREKMKLKEVKPFYSNPCPV